MILRAKDKWVIGLTGSMLSGKSTALAYFAKNGAEVLSADEIVRSLYQQTAVQKRLINWFGSCEPATVARCVFADEKAREKLEKFLHPKVLAVAAEAVKKSPKRLFVFEVPLLFEAGWDKLTDLNIVVLGNPATLKERLKARGVTLAEYKRRLAGQLPEKEKAHRADMVLSNWKDKKDLGLKIKRLCLAFESIYGVK